MPVKFAGTARFTGPLYWMTASAVSAMPTMPKPAAAAAAAETLNKCRSARAKTDDLCVARGMTILPSNDCAQSVRLDPKSTPGCPQTPDTKCNDHLTRISLDRNTIPTRFHIDFSGRRFRAHTDPGLDGARPYP